MFYSFNLLLVDYFYPWPRQHLCDFTFPPRNTVSRLAVGPEVEFFYKDLFSLWYIIILVFFPQTVQFTVLWILFLSIVLGNGAVLVALSFNKARKNRMNFFIMHLALAGKYFFNGFFSLTWVGFVYTCWRSSYLF